MASGWPLDHAANAQPPGTSDVGDPSSHTGDGGISRPSVLLEPDAAGAAAAREPVKTYVVQVQIQRSGTGPSRRSTGSI